VCCGDRLNRHRQAAIGAQRSERPLSAHSVQCCAIHEGRIWALSGSSLHRPLRSAMGRKWHSARSVLTAALSRIADHYHAKREGPFWVMCRRSAPSKISLAFHPKRDLRSSMSACRHPPPVGQLSSRRMSTPASGKALPFFGNIFPALRTWARLRGIKGDVPTTGARSRRLSSGLMRR
jgi:hypothetical protein